MRTINYQSRHYIFDYDPDANLVGTNRDNGVLSLNSVRADGTLNSISHAQGPLNLSNFSYTRDPGAQVASVATTGAGPLSLDDHTYSYSGLNQLTGRDSNSGAYTYEPADNLATDPYGATQSYDDAHQLESVDLSLPETAWGTTGDKPVPADFDGDGRADLAVWRPGNATWYVIPSSGAPPSETQWGTNGDVPVPADYDGDGRADIAIYRPQTAQWLVSLAAVAQPRPRCGACPATSPSPATTTVTA